MADQYFLVPHGMLSLDRRKGSTNSSDSLHAQHEWIAGQVSGVRKSVFLPQLSKEILGGPHLKVVDGKVAYHM